MLHQARKVLPKATCLMLYKTIVLLLFDYYSSVWDSCGFGSKVYLDKLSRHATCIIEGQTVGADDLKSMLSWPSLQAHRQYLKCILVYKCLHGIAPSYLLSEFKYAHEIHSYNTRHHDHHDHHEWEGVNMYKAKSARNEKKKNLLKGQKQQHFCIFNRPRKI